MPFSTHFRAAEIRARSTQDGFPTASIMIRLQSPASLSVHAWSLAR